MRLHVTIKQQNSDFNKQYAEEYNDGLNSVKNEINGIELSEDLPELVIFSELKTYGDEKLEVLTSLENKDESKSYLSSPKND